MHLGEETIVIYGRRRSIVRTIGSLLPDCFFAPVDRIYLHEDLFKTLTKGITEATYYNQDDDNSSDRSSSRNSSRKSTLCTCQDYDKLDSVSTKNESVQILEQQLQELRDEVARLFCSLNELSQTVDQQSHNFNQSSTLQISNVINTQSHDCSTPIPPPPPPPPFQLSANSYSEKRLLRKSLSVDSNINKKVNKAASPFISMADILLEMRTHKLKPVPRSPGGCSKKSISAPEGINNDLRSVLRKRYSAMKIDTPDSKKTCSDSDDSGTWDSPQVINNNRLPRQKRLLF